MRRSLIIIFSAGLILLVSLYRTHPSGPIKAAHPSGEFIAVSIATLLDTGQGSVVLLKEVDGERYLPISIGDPETRAIVLALERQHHPERAPRLDRPLTHNLLLDIMAKLGGHIDYVAVSDLQDRIYYADIYLKVLGRKEIKIDARPSDALALAITLEKPVPIYVTRSLMARSGKKGPQLWQPDETEQRKALRL